MKADADLDVARRIVEMARSYSASKEWVRLFHAAEFMVHAMGPEESPAHIHEAWNELRGALDGIRLAAGSNPPALGSAGRPDASTSATTPKCIFCNEELDDHIPSLDGGYGCAGKPTFYEPEHVTLEKSQNANMSDGTCHDR